MARHNMAWLQLSAIAMAGSLCAGTASSVSAAPAATDVAAITNVLTTSAKAWAKGDLDGFMQSYEDSPRTTYITGNDVLHGYAAVRKVYAPRLTGPGSSPGVLTVKVDTVEPLGPGYALTTGHFQLTRPAVPGSVSRGIFTLVFHKTASGWRIISDHTS